jgi:prophage maintenance system killer protein
VTVYLTVEDWVAAVLAFVEEMTVDDLVALRLDAAQRALLMPAAAVGSVELYPDIHEKAAALLTELLHQQPVGPDRIRAVATYSALLFLAYNDHTWDPSVSELVYWVTEADQGRLSIRTLADAIRAECATGQGGERVACAPDGA